MAASPTAVVINILNIIDDPNNPGVNVVLTIAVKLLFMGPVPLEQQIDVSVLNTSTKAQLKAAVDAAIIAAATALGFPGLTAARIITIADVAG